MTRTERNVLSNIHIKSKNFPDTLVKLSNWAAHLSEYSTARIDKCIFAEEESKRPCPDNMSWEAWKRHVETECDG